jgi:hypothetical protein
MDPLAGLEECSPTRFTRWRLRSRACAAADAAVTMVTGAMIAVAAVDSVVSWPSDRVLIPDTRLLSPITKTASIACVLWAMLGIGMIFGGRGRNRAVRTAVRPAFTPRVAALLAAVAAIVAVVAVGGHLAGTARGEARVLPGPRYEVAVRGVGDGDWTPVPADRYRTWQARFVREDGMLTIFLAVLMGLSLGLLDLHRRATRPAPGRASPRPDD